MLRSMLTLDAEEMQERVEKAQQTVLRALFRKSRPSKSHTNKSSTAEGSADGQSAHAAVSGRRVSRMPFLMLSLPVAPARLFKSQYDKTTFVHPQVRLERLLRRYDW